MDSFVKDSAWILQDMAYTAEAYPVILSIFPAGKLERGEMTFARKFQMGLLLT